MKIKNEKNQNNNAFYQDINLNDKLLINKIFRYFYIIFQEKKSINPLSKIIQIIIEAIQLISYAFSKNHYNSWKLDKKNIKIISHILESFKLTTFLQFIKYNEYLVIFYILLIIIFILCLIVLLNIIFIASLSKYQKLSITLIHSFVDIISIIFFIPIIEIILIPIKCVNGKVNGFKDGELCWGMEHYIHFIFGIIGTILLLALCFFIIFFSFFPFQNSLSSIRISSNNDIVILFLKLFVILQNLLISNEYVSLAILLLISIFMFFVCYNNSTYSNSLIETFICIKNLSNVWTYFVLFISKLFETVIADGFIFFLILGYPLIIYLSITLSQEKEHEIIKSSFHFNNLNEFIKKAKYNIKLVNSFIEINQSNGEKIKEKKNILLLKGRIMFHNSICTDMDCPLTKFMNNEGNINAQKQCLLNYINRFFINGIKLFPNNYNILILFIYFNYSKRFNLNTSRAYFSQLKKIDCNIKEKYIIYCLDQIIKINYKNDNVENENKNNNQIYSTEEKYHKIKYLIENSIKYFSEFWGTFSSNISSKINAIKLYDIGEKLNIYLNEINYLWDVELKNLKIGNECQNIAELYSKFLSEVLWDQKRSKEISTKIKNEGLNNYNLNNNKKLNDNFINNIESLSDNQDFLLFLEYDEKKNCKIIQISSSFSYFLYYQKAYIIGKSIKKIFPDILIDEIYKSIDEKIKLLHTEENKQNYIKTQENEFNQNSELTIIKNKMGYIFPIYSSCIALNDTDYSDSFLVKYRFENKQPKSEYGYFLLTNFELSIENISSSAINLGLSLDLLKKYIVKINNLIRTVNDEELNINEKYKEFEEESKEIKWIFPDIIYPKDNIQHNNEDKIQELIQKSNKKKYNLQIKAIKFKENETKAFLFKFTEIELKKGRKKLNEELYIPKASNKLIMFYLKKLNYIRTQIVEQKTGLQNLENEDELSEIQKEGNNKTEMNKNYKKRRSVEMSEDDSGENYKQNILTKEKIIELQVYNFIEIKNFIFSLPIYGTDVSLERFRPNRDKYSASKITESLIKINLNKFCKRINATIGLDKNLKIEHKNNINKNNNSIISTENLNNDNYFSSMNNSLPNEKVKSSSFNQVEEVNKGLLSESSSSFSNIFKDNIIKYISLLFDLTFFFIIILLCLSFILIRNHMNKIKSKTIYMNNGYIILNNLLYTKHYVTEGVLSNILSYYFISFDIKKELSSIRQEITETYDKITSSDLCKEFKNYLKNTNTEIFTLTLDIHEKINLTYDNAISRIASSINNIISDPSSLDMGKRDTYELMHNLLNNYFMTLYEAMEILSKNIYKDLKYKIPLLLIVFGYLIISIILFTLFLKLLSKYSFEREKPINLFLTMKKVVFENLKNSVENFSNKLLNKVFENGEENEQESQKEYKINIKKNDINIAKFKAANEYNSSISNICDFMIIIIILFIFLCVNFIYIVASYLSFRKNMESIEQFLILFDNNNIDHSDTVLTLEVFKSFLFNKSIPILKNEKTINEFILVFLTPTERFENSIINISRRKSFLTDKYLKKYKQYFLGDYSELLDKSFVDLYGAYFGHYLNYGIKPMKIYIIDVIRFYFIKYFISGEVNINEDKISNLLKQSEYQLMEINMMLEAIIRKWYNGISKLLIDSFYDYHKKTRTKYIILFICLLIIDVLYYLIIWKIYQEKLKTMLKESISLINLIPEEIKAIIMEKIVE